MLHSARAIETAPHGPAEERPFLLWCPEQGGWQTGVWFKGQWIAQEPFSPDSLDGNSVRSAKVDFARGQRGKAW